MSLCYLYKITNTNIPILYIGITNNPNARFREHKNNSSNKLLKIFFSRLDISTFIFDILSEGTRHDMEELEALAIIEGKSLDRFMVCNVLNGSVFTGASAQIGTDHWNASFTEQDVLHIRNIYSLGGVTQKEIGEIYGVSNKVISKITAGERWRHIGGNITNNSLCNRPANRRKLSDNQVQEVRQEALEEYNITGSVDIPEIAELYNVSRGGMRLILKGISYSKVGGPIIGKDYYKEFGRGSR